MNKKQLFLTSLLISVILLIALFSFWGCAGMQGQQKEMTPEQITEGQKKTREFYSKQPRWMRYVPEN